MMWLRFVVLRCRGSRIWGRILTFEEVDHGNADTALPRSFCIMAVLEASVSGKQNKGLFWAARYYKSPIISYLHRFFVFSSASWNILNTLSIIHLAKNY
jgi:hypothetical protein